MAYRSAANLPTKQDRAMLLLLALASLLTRAGERIALLGDQRRPDRRPRRRDQSLRPVGRAAGGRLQRGPGAAAAAPRAPRPDQRFLHAARGPARPPARVSRDGRAGASAPGPGSGGAEPAVRRPGAVRRARGRRRGADRQRRGRAAPLSGSHRGPSPRPPRRWRATSAGRSRATSATIRPSRRCWLCTMRSRPGRKARRCCSWAGSA